MSAINKKISKSTRRLLASIVRSLVSDEPCNINARTNECSTHHWDGGSDCPHLWAKRFLKEEDE